MPRRQRLAAPTSSKKDGEKFEEWKNQTKCRAKFVSDNVDGYTKPSQVLHDIYEYMRRNYGIVWESEFFEWSQIYHESAKYLNVIYDNEMYRSIFDSILLDRVGAVEI